MNHENFLKVIALFCIELVIFMPIYAADVMATPLVISGVTETNDYNSAEITWQTDVSSSSIVNYGKTSLVELSKTEQGSFTNHLISLSTLLTSTLYYYKVKSCDGADCTSSALNTFTTSIAPAPLKIKGLANGTITTKGVNLIWNKTSSNYFLHYLIYRNGNAVANTSSVQYSDTGLSGGTTYQYEVSAVNVDSVEGEKSDSLYATTLVPDTTPPTIDNVSIGSISKNSVTIEWVTDEDSNSTVNYGTSSLDLIKSSSEFATKHSITLNNLQNSTNYNYEVVSCDKDGNCVQESSGLSFTPAEIKPLSMNIKIPFIYNKAIVPINGIVTPNTEVKFFVNNIYKGLISMKRNTNGSISFNVPGFSAGNNTLKVIIEDIIGSKKETNFNIDIDMSPPVLTLTPLPSVLSSSDVMINGSVNEEVDIKIFVNSIGTDDTEKPGKVTNFHADTISENSVKLAWVDITDKDFKEYIIYRDDIPIGTAVASPFEDDFLVSSEKSYRYAIAAVDTSCNVGNSVVLNLKTKSGGIIYNSTPDPENIECGSGVTKTPVSILTSQYLLFKESIKLNQGMNEVTVVAIDKAGNIVKRLFKIDYDSIKPEILSSNIDTLSPSYVRDVTITGTVSEDANVCVHINSEIEVKPYRKDEVNESGISGKSKFCADTSNKEFSIDVKLRRDPDYAIDREKQTTETQWMQANTGTAWSNNIKIIATDKVGLSSDPEEGDINYALCGGGTDWSILTDKVIPSEIIPLYLIEGMAQIGISVDLKWRGSGARPGISDIDVYVGFPLDLNEQDDSEFDDEWVSGRPYDSWSDEKEKGYIMLNLKVPEFDSSKNLTMLEKENNLSEHNKGKCFNVPFTDKSAIEAAGCVRIPLTFDISYDKEVTDTKRGKIRKTKTSVRQKECMTIDVLIQPRIPPKTFLPDFLLEGTVEMLDATIEFIDTILEPLKTVVMATMITCFAMWLILFSKKASEGINCFNVNMLGGLTGKDKVKACECTAEKEGLDCGEGERAKECERCMKAKIQTKSFERLMQWTCDRVMCPAVPSFEKYVKDNQAKDSKSNCKGASYSKESEYWRKADEKEKCKNAPKGLVSDDGKPIQAEKECCEEEYYFEWNSGAIMMNELEESAEVSGKKDTGDLENLWRAVSDFSLCREKNEGQRQINYGKDGLYILEKNPKWESWEEKTLKERGKDSAPFKILIWEGQGVTRTGPSSSNPGQISTESNVEKKEELTGKYIIQGLCKKYLDPKEESYKHGESGWPKFTSQASIITEKSIAPLDHVDFDALPAGYSLGEPEDKIIITNSNVKKYVPKNDVKGKANEDNNYTIKIENIYYQKDDLEKVDYQKETTSKNGVVYLDEDDNVVEISPQTLRWVKGPDGKYWYNKDGNQVSSFKIDNPGADTIDKKVTKSVARSVNSEIYIPEEIVREACSGVAEDYIIDPTEGLFRGMQAGCLTGVQSYLSMYKSFLTPIKSCFETIRLTGDGSAGQCQAVFSTYVCDLVYYLFSCFKGSSGFGKGGQNRGVLGFFRGVMGAGAEVQESIQGRYGTTNMFRAMFVEQKLVHSFCTGLFTGDFDFDLTGMTEQAIKMPIKPVINVVPATRRFTGFNPIDGITNHVYEIGMFIVSGADNSRYTVKLVCSNDNSCDSRYFENGYCDCAHPGKSEITMDITNYFDFNGALDQGETINDVVYVPIAYTNDYAKNRYDKVVVEYDYTDNKGNRKIEKTRPKEISQLGTEPIASCKYDLLSGYFRCSIFEESTTACITDKLEIYKGKESDTNTVIINDGGTINILPNEYITFRFKAKKQTITREDQKDFFTAEVEIFDKLTGDLITKSQSYKIDSTIEEPVYISLQISDGWFGGSTYGCIEIENNINGVTVTSCGNSRMTITCVEEGDNEFTFKSSGKIDCDSISERDNRNEVFCNGYNIKIDNINDINCESDKRIVVERSTNTKTQGKDTNDLDYVLRIYRPQTKSTSTKRVASCKGIRQEEEGSFVVSKGDVVEQSIPIKPIDVATGTTKVEGIYEKYGEFIEKKTETSTNNYVTTQMIVAIIAQETNFAKPDEISPDGAVGLMQLMPATAKYDLNLKVPDENMGNKNPKTINPIYDERFDVDKNIAGGTKYLQLRFEDCINKLNIKGKEEQEKCAFAEYNTGPSNVEKAISRSPNNNYDIYKNQFPDTKQTIPYVEGVLKYMKLCEDSDKCGLM